MRFIALPVGSGDAFYVETEDKFRVLVDGGRSRDALPQLFQRYTGSSEVDVLVCTHNDADHAEGLIGFLENRLNCRELWLPATWLEAVRNLPADVKETISFLWENLDRASEKGLLRRAEEGQDFQDIAWRTVFPEFSEEQPIRDNPLAEEMPEGQDAHALDAYLDNSTMAAMEEHLDFFACAWPWYWEIPWRWLPFACWRHFVIIQDTRRLLELAWIALNRGIPVRCFAHDPTNTGEIGSLRGYPLQPLSAKPSHYVRPPKPTKAAKEFFWTLFLTTVNRESLVFFLNAGDGQPGVLFTADSDLKGVNVDHVPAWSIATAPHHGSDENRSVYAHVNKPMVWVRSDGYSKIRPCQEFLKAPGKRFCTLCRNSREPKQAVRLYRRRGSWVPLRTRLCQCW